MRYPTDMPELQEDVAALGMHRIGHLAPAVDLRLRVYAGRVLVALTLLRNLLRVNGAMTMRLDSVREPSTKGSKSVLLVIFRFQSWNYFSRSSRNARRVGQVDLSLRP